MIRLNEWLRRAQTKEEGSALVMALVFMLLLGLAMAALLAFAETSFRHTQSVVEQGMTIYDADGAIEAAIQKLRTNTALGNTGGSCPAFDMSVGNGTTMTVECTPYSGSGGGLGSNVTNTPSLALLTMSHQFIYAGEDGYEQGSNNEIRMRGGVFSNSNVDTAAGGSSSSLVVTGGSINSRLPCTGTISPACTVTTTVTDDPEYASLATATFVNQPVPSCVGGIATFLPGRYTSAGGMTGFICPLLLFPSGVYYFDFQDSGQSNQRVWTLSGSRVRAGAYDTVTQQCTAGAQFIFGGESQWSIQDGQIEMCPQTPVPDGQRISLFGAGSVKRLFPTTAANTGSVQFTPTSSAMELDGSMAAATMTGSSANLRLGGLSAPGLSGKNISAARVIVTHQDVLGASTNFGQVSIGLNLTDARGRTTNVTSGLTENGAVHTDIMELSGTWLSDPASYGASGVTADFSASANSGRTLTERIDGIWLQVIWATPPLAPARGCLIATASASRCNLIMTSNNPGNSMSVTGTVYAPASKFDITLNNVQSQVFSRGVVARAIRSSITGSSTFTGQFFSLTAATGSGVRKVLLVAREPNGTPRIRAVISIDDNTIGNPVSVLSWRVLRGA